MKEDDVKSIIDDFESENFVDAQSKLKTVIQGARDEFLQNKLGLKSFVKTDIDNNEINVNNVDNNEINVDNNIEPKKPKRRLLKKK